MIFEAPDDNFAGIFGKDKHLFRAAQWLSGALLVTLIEIVLFGRDCSYWEDCSLRKIVLFGK